MKYAVVALLLATAAAEDKPKKEDPKKETPAPAACTLSKLEVFTDVKCTKAPETALTDDETKALKKSLTENAGKCTSGVKVVCDGTGITSTKYKKDDCTGDVDADATKDLVPLKWGECSKAGDKYVKATGAKALMASAAVALAFIGSQF